LLYKYLANFIKIESLTLYQLKSSLTLSVNWVLS